MTANPIPSQPPIAGSEIYQRLLKESVFIASDVNENWCSMAFGTGWVLDKARRMIVTNHLVVSYGLKVRPERIVHVYFPYFEKGELLTDRWRYVKERKSIKAEIYDTDPKRDMAILILDDLPDEASALPLSRVYKAAANIGRPFGSSSWGNRALRQWRSPSNFLNS